MNIDIIAKLRLWFSWYCVEPSPIPPSPMGWSISEEASRFGAREIMKFINS